MLKTVIVLPDGTELSSGQGEHNAIQSTSIIECVNSGTELIIGSTCANSIEVKIIAPDGTLSIQTGTEMEVYREDENGLRHKVGIFVAEMPTRVTASTLKVLGYDRVSKLDKDLTAWLAGLTGWPYTPPVFAEMVCAECGVPYKASPLPNAAYKIKKFSKSTVTGRQLMKWLGEICCRFCRADSDGNIEFAWYAPSDFKITATGDNYYFQNGLSYEDYSVEKIQTANVRLADSDSGALWPADPEFDGFPENPNRYIITGNPILTTELDQGVDDALRIILHYLGEISYTPCKVSLPASMNVHAGDIIQITDKNGVTFTTYVMTKTQEGQKDTLECTGAQRRDSSSATNNKTQAEKDASMEEYANAAAQNAVRAQTGVEIFNKITENGTVQGIYQQDGKWYINGEFAQVFNLVANFITSGRLQSKSQKTYFDLDSGRIAAEGSNGMTVLIENGLVACIGANDKAGALLYASDAGSVGLLQLGLCQISGTANTLIIQTADSDTRNMASKNASWKSIRWEDSNGTVHYDKVLVGT